MYLNLCNTFVYMYTHNNIKYYVILLFYLFLSMKNYVSHTA